MKKAEIKNKIKNYIYNKNYKLKKIIIMESNPDYADNTKYVYDEILNRKINNEYKIIWFVSDDEKFEDVKIKNVKFLNRYKSIVNKILYKYYSFNAKYIIDCNRYIYKKNKNQYRIHLTHGMPFKIAKEYNANVGETDILISQADYFLDKLIQIYNMGTEQIITTGYPRTDAFFKEDKLLDIKDNKIIVWMPTYRNHNRKESYEYGEFLKYGVPCIDIKEQLEELNELLKENNILLMIKLHPAEKDNEISKITLSNIIITKNEIFEKEHKNVYDLLNQSDALITDYSSIYYDYLLKNKPIGMAIPDIEEYKRVTPLWYDDLEENLPGEYIYTFEDLKEFIRNIAQGKDIKNKERNEKCRVYNKYNDGKCSKRVVDILEKHMEGR